VAAEAGHGLGDGVLVFGRDLPPVLGIELPGDGGRADEVAEEDGELPALTFGRRPAERGAARTAELLFRVVARATRGACLAEVDAAGRAVAAVGAVRVAAGGAAQRAQGGFLGGAG
jgi:hypothetical protein